jgi:outer membrane protein
VCAGKIMRHLLVLVCLCVSRQLFAEAPSADNAPSVFDLQRCLATALEENFEIRKARERIEQQYAVKVQARAHFFPSLDLHSTYDRIDEKRIPSYQGVRFGADQDWTANAVVSENIFAGGGNIAALRQAEALNAAAKRELETVINDVVLQVKTRFYDALLAQAELQVQEENVKLLEEEFRLQQNRLMAGAVSKFNVLRAEVALANSKAPYIRARNRTKISLEELRRVLGLSLETETPARVLEVKGTLSYVPAQIDLEQALAEAARSRPELKRLESTVEAGEQAVRAARADYYPSLSIQGGYRANKSPFDDDFESELHGWDAGARASWNIFDGFATSGRVAEAKSAKRVQRLSLAQAKVDIEVEVRRAHSSLLEADELVKASRKVEEQALESLRLARARFAAGASPQIDVLDSQVALTQARTNQVLALYTFNVAQAALERAMGTRIAP